MMINKNKLQNMLTWANRPNVIYKKIYRLFKNKSFNAFDLLSLVQMYQSTDFKLCLAGPYTKLFRFFFRQLVYKISHVS